MKIERNGGAVKAGVLVGLDERKMGADRPFCVAAEWGIPVSLHGAAAHHCLYYNWTFILHYLKVNEATAKKLHL